MKTASIIALVVLASPLAAEAKLGRKLVAAPQLNRCNRFAIHGETAVTNTGDNIITGDIGSTTAITGFLGTAFFGDIPAGQPDTVAYDYYTVLDLEKKPTTIACKDDKETAYDFAEGQVCGTSPGIELGGKGEVNALEAGVYCSATNFDINGDLYLTGDAESVFVFQMATTFKTGPSAKIILLNGVQAKNVYWQVGSAVNIGTLTQFKGNILSWKAIKVGYMVEVEGRLLSFTGVTLDAGSSKIALP